MPKLIDLTKSKEPFGLWTVVRRVVEGGRTRWLCRCECGTERVVNGGNLREGLSTSCGCTRADGVRAKVVTHGLTRDRKRPRTYNAWSGMVQRCTNPNA